MAVLTRREFLAAAGVFGGLAVTGCGALRRAANTLTGVDTFELAYRRITARPAARRQPPAIAFPDGKAPRVIQTRLDDESELPHADVLVVTYTEAEGEALADILTPGLNLHQWTPYRNGWPQLHQLIEGGRAPSLHSHSAGMWAVVAIGDVVAVVVKSDLHPATDGPRLPIAAAWRRWVSQVQPKLVISTGTAGAVQDTTQLGDVIVSRHVTWDCRKQFVSAPWAGQSYESTAPVDKETYEAIAPWLRQTSTPLPDLKRPPVCWIDDEAPAHVITTDFFAFDDVEDSYGLQKFDPKARAVEMDDAAMAYALTDPAAGHQLLNRAQWLIIRNASDPQMPREASTQTEAKDASRIYEHYGQVTSWGSALACWAACNAITA
jgi:hypothetical protein